MLSLFLYIRNDASCHHRIQDATTPVDKIEQQGNDGSFHSHFSEYCSQSVHEHRESLAEQPALHHALHEKIHRIGRVESYPKHSPLMRPEAREASQHWWMNGFLQTPRKCSTHAGRSVY